MSKFMGQSPDFENNGEPEGNDDTPKSLDGEEIVQVELTPEETQKPVERVGKTNRVIDEAMRGKLVNFVLWMWVGMFIPGFGGALYYHDGVYLNPMLAVTAIVAGQMI
jgi:hypothetical protein